MSRLNFLGIPNEYSHEVPYEGPNVKVDDGSDASHHPEDNAEVGNDLGAGLHAATAAAAPEPDTHVELGGDVAFGKLKKRILKNHDSHCKLD